MKHLIDTLVLRSGLQVQHNNRERVEHHIQARVQALGLHQPEAFLDCLEPDSPHQARELELLAEVLTTGETFFMRDAGQMQFLRETLLPELVARRRSQGQLRLRLWSSACATGEEAYSLAILVSELLPDRFQWRLDLYGTDVSRAALHRAQAGVYSAWAFRGCDEAFRQRHFHPHGDQWRLHQSLRDLVRFLPCDLIREGLPDPGRGLAEMDLILCRNLFIYLHPEAIEGVTHKLAASLSEGGVLLTGHGELRAHRPAQLQVEAHPQTLVYRKGGRGTTVPPQPGKAGQGEYPPSRTLRGPSSAPPAGGPAPGVKPITPLTSPPGGDRPATSRPTGDQIAITRPSGDGPAPVRPRYPPVAPASVPADASANAPADAKASTSPDFSRAWRLADAGRLQEAQELCQRLRAQNPMEAEAHFLAAVLAEELGDSAAARDALRKVIYLEPAMIAAHVHLERLQSLAAEVEVARKTRETLARLLADLPAEMRVPWMGDTRVGELRSHYAR